MNGAQQVERLVGLGVHRLAQISSQELVSRAETLSVEDGDVLVVHPDCVPASRLAPLLTREDRAGFVVTDMGDLDVFGPIAGVELPEGPLYVLRDVERGDEMRSWSPDEALPAVQARGRTPLTVSEGICWLLQHPDRLEPNHCFMTIGSRKPNARGLDARTPAIWISGGTGRDGKEHRGAPKVGWCWAGNRHTWLGFASAAGRHAT
jgi:Family of unknown function (DUF5701)